MTDKRTVLFALILALCLPNHSSARTLDRLIENRHFAILHAQGDRRIAQALERESLAIRSRIIADIGVDFPEKTEVRLCPTMASFHEVQVGNAQVPLWAVGAAYPRENIIVLLSPRAIKSGRIEITDVFAHEFSHIALGRALAGVDIPSWLDEGLAIYEAREWNFSRNYILTRGVLTNRLIPLAVITGAFPGDPLSAELAYAESFMLISFLIDKLGRESFHRFIRDYIRFGDLEVALRRATGMTPGDLEKQWLSYLKRRVSWIPIMTSASVIWFLMVVIFLSGYLRKRFQMRQRLREMDEEEHS